MEEQRPSYRSEFLKSPHHAVLGLVTLGAGFISANVLGLIAGATAYVLGWIYVPDFAMFRSWVDRKFNSARSVEEAQRLAQFQQKREALLRSLDRERQERYVTLAHVCRDIEAATAESSLAADDPSSDPRLRKLDELMWTFLRLLGIEQSLHQFLHTEKEEDVPGMLKEGQDECAGLSAEIEALRKSGSAAAADSKQRYLNSRNDRVEVLRKRQQRIVQAGENLALVLSEQERLEQQIKLLRADAVATRNAEALTARIDATVEHLDQTNKWLSELDEFKDLTGDIPATSQRIGYAATPSGPPPPPLIDQIAKQQSAAQRRRQAQS